MIYLDYAATTPVREEVLSVIEQTLREQYANASSIYQSGKKSKSLLENARKQVANLLNVLPQHVFFTSGATEANNWAIKIQAAQSKHRMGKNHILVSSIEHPSVLEVCRFLEKTEEYVVEYITPNAEQCITAQMFIDKTTERTAGWIAMAVNNETGDCLPIEALANLSDQYNVWLHVDAVQAVGCYDIPQNVTSFVSSGHKLGAPKGIGVLVYRGKQPLEPLLHGGGQEKGKRSGTENLSYILGYAKALELASQERTKSLVNYENLSGYLYSRLVEMNIPYYRNGHVTHHVNHIHSLYLKNILSSQVLIQMDLAGIAISAGSACSAGSVIDSPILKQFYPYEPERWRESIRISFGKQTTEKDIDAFVQQLKQLQERSQSKWHSQNKQH